MPVRIGVMGGTFDPIHHGHLVAASEAHAAFELDEVLFVPTGQPWQKSDRQVTSGEHRFAMTSLATQSNDAFSVSRVDLDRDGPTYTVDTLRDLQAQQPEAELFFITGADALAAIMSWRDHETLFDVAHFVGCTRPGHVVDREMLDRLPQERLSVLEIPALAISSTDCRERAQRGAPIRYLVPDSVVEYINEHDLYASHQEGSR